MLANEKDDDSKLDKVHENLKKVDIDAKGLRFGDSTAHYREEADLDDAAKAFYDKAGTS